MGKQLTKAQIFMSILEHNNLDIFKNDTHCALERYLSFLCDLYLSYQIDRAVDVASVYELCNLYLDKCIKDKEKKDQTIKPGTVKVIRMILNENASIDTRVVALIEVLGDLFDYFGKKGLINYVK